MISLAPQEPLPAVSREQLEKIFHLKYGRPDETGWGPRTRWRAGHFNPDDHYEALVDELVTSTCRWLDVGCGRNLFPSNKALARLLSDRCELLVGVDPDPTLAENPYVDVKVQKPVEEFRSETEFDLVTLRMVAEHVERPVELAKTLADCTAPGGYVVVYTVNKFSPVPLLTSVVPFALHHPMKRLLWRGDRKDTFPTCFRMNTRRRLSRIFNSAGFDEVFFEYLDDCRTTGGYRFLQRLELRLWGVTRRLGIRYPENCLLGVYRKRGAVSVSTTGGEAIAPRLETPGRRV